MCVDRWVGEDAGCIDSGALLSRKTECHNASHSNKDEREMTVLSEPERERQRPHGITCMENMKHDARQHIYRTQTDRQTRPAVAKGEGSRGGGRILTPHSSDQSAPAITQLLLLLSAG